VSDNKGDNKMEDMIVVVYENEYEAQENMGTLRNLSTYDWMVDIHDAVAVVRDTNGKLHIQDSYRASPKAGAGWGVLLGTILGGLVLAPLTGGLSTAAAAGVVAAGAVSGAAIGGTTGAAVAVMDKDEHGLSEEFVSEVSESIKKGESAIFALVESHDPRQVAEYFRGTGGTIVRTNLTPSQQERIQQILTASYYGK
jgi:uncharacterized membrane protein